MIALALVVAGLSVTAIVIGIRGTHAAVWDALTRKRVTVTSGVGAALGGH